MYSLIDFLEGLIQNIMDFDKYADPSVYCTAKETSIFSSAHIPEFSDVKRMCKVCYLKETV